MTDLGSGSASGDLLIDLLTGLVIALGVLGVVVPVLPGVLLIAGAMLVWAGLVGTGEAWAYAGAAVGVLAVGQVAKYLLPGRRLRESGVPTSTLLAGAVLGVVGFFVVPVVGLVLGFVLGVYLAETQRLGREQAWPSTVHAVKAVGLAVLIELVSSLLAAAVWLVGALAT